jgi:hypothetical protein
MLGLVGLACRGAQPDIPYTNIWVIILTSTLMRFRVRSQDTSVRDATSTGIDVNGPYHPRDAMFWTLCLGTHRSGTHCHVIVIFRYVQNRRKHNIPHIIAVFASQTLPGTLSTRLHHRCMHALQRNLNVCIPRKAIARPQPQFPHSYVH